MLSPTSRALANNHPASKHLAPIRSRLLIPPTPLHHDNIISNFTPSPASKPTPFSAFQITRTVWDYQSVQRLGVQGWIILMTRIEWHLKGRIGRNQDRSSLCRFALRVLEQGAIGGRLPQMPDTIDSNYRPKRRSLHENVPHM